MCCDKKARRRWHEAAIAILQDIPELDGDPNLTIWARAMNLDWIPMMEAGLTPEEAISAAVGEGFAHVEAPSVT